MRVGVNRPQERFLQRSQDEGERPEAVPGSCLYFCARCGEALSLTS